MRILGIDPGATCGVVVVDSETMGILVADNMTPEALHEWIYSSHVAELEIDMAVIEGMANQGSGYTGDETWETAYFIGELRFILIQNDVDPILLKRRDVKLALLGSVKGNDAAIRGTIVDRYGGKAKAIGTKKNPGPLYGVRGHAWSALAVALTYLDSHRRENER